MRLLIAFSMFVMFSFTLPPICSADDALLKELKSKRAKVAVQSYQRKVEQATAQFDQAVARETEKLIESLQNILKQETADGNFEEAVRLKAAIESLENESSGKAGADESSKMIGLWKFQYGKGHTLFHQFEKRDNRLYTIRLDRNKKPYDAGVVPVKDGKFYFNHAKHSIVERYTLDGDRVIIEHWSVRRNKSIDRFPDDFGIGVRVEPDGN